MIQFASAILPRPLLSFPTSSSSSDRFPATSSRAHLRESSRVSSRREDIPERVNPCATYRDCLLSPFYGSPFRLSRGGNFPFTALRGGCNFYFRSTDRMHLGAAPPELERAEAGWCAREDSLQLSGIDMRQLGLVNYRVSTQARAALTLWSHSKKRGLEAMVRTWTTWMWREWLNL